MAGMRCLRWGVLPCRSHVKRALPAKPALSPHRAHHVPTVLVVQAADWEFEDQAADDDLDQGASEEEEGLADDPGLRKKLGARVLMGSCAAAGRRALACGGAE